MISKNRIDWLKQVLIYTMCILFLGILIHEMGNYLWSRGNLETLVLNSNEGDGFRKQEFSTFSIEQIRKFVKTEQVELSSLLTVLLSQKKFDGRDIDLRSYTLEDYQEEMDFLKSKNDHGFEQLKQSYKAIWEDIEYFPIPVAKDTSVPFVTYEDSWMFERNYGGKRGHEGVDLMAGVEERGKYPVISMTDGVVERIGWLEKGGYRIGIRSTNGGYFYYAHLSHYSESFKEGQSIKAGQLLGFMGDSGYGPEGTMGQFPIHLHLGIYIRTENQTEVSVNPYWILKYFEEDKLTYYY